MTRPSTKTEQKFRLALVVKVCMRAAEKKTPTNRVITSKMSTNQNGNTIVKMLNEDNNVLDVDQQL